MSANQTMRAAGRTSTGKVFSFDVQRGDLGPDLDDAAAAAAFAAMVSKEIKTDTGALPSVVLVGIQGDKK